MQYDQYAELIVSYTQNHHPSTAWTSDAHTPSSNLSQLPFAVGEGGSSAPSAAPPQTFGISPAQFYARRDHTFGGSASRLDRLRSHHEFPNMESFAEVDEEGEEKEDESKGMDYNVLK